MKIDNSSLADTCIILVNYNGWQDTLECIESILKNEYKKFSIIIIDNNSTDDSINKINDWAQGKITVTAKNANLKRLVSPSISKPIQIFNYNNWKEIKEFKSQSIHLIHHNQNKGFAAGNNIGIKAVLEIPYIKYIWLLNNDTVIEKNTLRMLIEFHQKKSKLKEKIGFIGSILKYYNEPKKIQAFGGIYNKKWGIPKKNTDMDKKNTDYVVGASMFFDIILIKDIGLMCEDYFLYFEELDWQKRADYFKKPPSHCKESIVYHKEGATTQKNKISKTPISTYYGTRSTLLFTRKFYKEYYPFVLLRTFCVLVFKCIKGDFKASKAVLYAILGLKLQ